MALQVKLPNGTLGRLEFQHIAHPAPVLHKRLSGRAAVITHTTIARVMIGPKETEEEFVSGTAFCALGDNFCRAKGREQALAHMLQLDKGEAARPLSRWLTGEILQAYYNRRPKGRKEQASYGS